MTTRTSVQTIRPSSSIASGLAVLAEPPTRQVDGAMMDYFLIEVVNTLKASAAVATARAKQIEKEMVDSGLIPPPASTAPPSLPLKKDSVRESITGRPASTPTTKVPEDEEEAVRTRLENIGIHVGANFTERLCRDRTLFGETLDAIKFICKDIWGACWDKQVDNLRTNHRGIYVLQDNAFKPIARLSSYQGRAEALARAKLYVALPAGIIRGAITRLGYVGTVSPEITTLPQCTFQIKLPPKNN